MDKVVFLDRDGLINQRAPEHDYIKQVEDFIFLPGVFEAVKRLNDAGFLTVVVTNQRGIARGFMTPETLAEIHKFMCTEFEQHGGKISAIYVCPHEEGTCTCHKPDIGLFLQAEKDFDIDKSASWMVGDSDSDTEAGRRYGVKSIQTTLLSEAVKIILEESYQ